MTFRTGFSGGGCCSRREGLGFWNPTHGVFASSSWILLATSPTKQYIWLGCRNGAVCSLKLGTDHIQQKTHPLAKFSKDCHFRMQVGQLSFQLLSHVESQTETSLHIENWHRKGKNSYITLLVVLLVFYKPGGFPSHSFVVYGRMV